jgi:hypothetical protein
MPGGTALEINLPAIDDYGPNQIPVFQNPYGCEPGLADMLAQCPVASSKYEGAL